MDAKNPHLLSSSYTAGIIAGPLFILSGIVHAFLRPGFDWVRHPLSLLSLGEWGWVQISSFVLPGLLYIACGVALKRAKLSGVGSTWAHRLLLAMAVGLIMGGVFTADPALGFPPGTPEGPPASMSWHSIIHAFAPILGFFSLLGFHMVIARRFRSQKKRSWMVLSLVIGIGSFVLTTIPNFTGDFQKGIYNFVPLWVGSGVIYIYTSFVLAKLRDEAIA